LGAKPKAADAKAKVKVIFFRTPIIANNNNNNVSIEMQNEYQLQKRRAGPKDWIGLDIGVGIPNFSPGGDAAFLLASSGSALCHATLARSPTSRDRLKRL
jgi:hypothetical protein